MNIYIYIHIYIYTHIYIYKDSFCDSIWILAGLSPEGECHLLLIAGAGSARLVQRLGCVSKKWETHGNFSWGILGSTVWLPKCGIQHIWRVYSNFLIFFGYTHLVCSELRKDRDKKCSPPGRRIRFGGFHTSADWDRLERLDVRILDQG